MPIPYTFHLNKIFRQTNKIEGNILARIRTGNQTDSDLEVLNQRVGSPQCGSTMLTPFVKTAESINVSMMESLLTRPYEFHATKTGTYKSKEGPLRDVLKLKEGCRVVIKCNMKTSVDAEEQIVVNGDTGVFEGIDKYDRMIILRDSDNEYVKVKAKKFELFTNTPIIDEDGNPGLQEKVSGGFKQYPVDLGYAMTIDKAQGSTMANIHLVLPNPSNGFWRRRYGLLYVALSRVPSFSCLTLSRPILHTDVVVKKGLKKQGEQQYELL